MHWIQNNFNSQVVKKSFYQTISMTIYCVYVEAIARIIFKKIIFFYDQFYVERINTNLRLKGLILD